MALRRPVCIAFHQRRMHSALARVHKLPFWDRRQGDYIEKYEHNRDKLVELGYLVRREFPLRHIRVPSEESRRFWQLLLEAFPDCPHTTMEGYEVGTPDAIIVWDRPSRIPAWEKFILEHDIPDFALPERRTEGLPMSLFAQALQACGGGRTRGREDRENRAA